MSDRPTLYAVFQLVFHEYSSDDGHYVSDTPDEGVWRSEAPAIQTRDERNTTIVLAYNAEVNDTAREYARGVMDDPAIQRYLKKNIFTGNPTDIDAIEKFANRTTCLTFWTIERLQVWG